MREGEEANGWRCVAVTRDPRNTARIRITCRDESELARMKAIRRGPKRRGHASCVISGTRSRWTTLAGQRFWTKVANFEQR